MVAVVLFVVYSAIRSMFYGSCGIGGLVRAEVNVNSRRHCSGRVWDVNLRTCDAHSTLTVSLPKCRVYEGQSDIIPSVIYEGQSDIIPSVIYEGPSDIIPSVIYEGWSDIIPSVIYEGQSDIIPSVIYEGQSNRLLLEVNYKFALLQSQI